MTQYLNGKTVAQNIRERLTRDIACHHKKTGRLPGLAVVFVGHDPASEVYVRNKGRAAKSLGMRSIEVRMPEKSTTDAVVATVDRLNRDPEVHGILVQLPLPGGIDRQRVIESIAARKDVDGLTPANQAALVQNQPGLRPCTPLGIMELLTAYNFGVAGKRVAIIGRSALVGLPVGLLCLQQNATVTIMHSKTLDPARMVRDAEVVIVAAGKPQLVTRDWVNPDAVVIDVGIHRTAEGLLGDVDFPGLDGYVRAISPVPGGVGPMTIAELLSNTFRAFLTQEPS